MSRKIFALVLFICCLIASTLQRQLKFVQVLSRHGARQPLYPNDYDFSDITLLHNSTGKLTLEGKSQLYILGQRLRQQYWGPLFGNSNFSQSYQDQLLLAKSTDLDRAIESLEALLFGLLEPLRDHKELSSSQFDFPPFPSPNSQNAINSSQRQIIQNLFTFPIQIQSKAQYNANVDKDEQMVVNLMGSCSNFKKWQHQSLNSPIAQSIYQDKRVQEALGALNIAYRRNNTTILSAFESFDNYISLKAMGHKYLPLFQNELIRQPLEYLFSARMFLLFSQELHSRVYSTGLLSATVSNMRQALVANPKLVLYSAHDSTLAIMLTALNFTNMQCLTNSYLGRQQEEDCYVQYPQFAATLIFQLWLEDDGELSVKILLNGKEHPIPVCPGLCSLDKFESWVSDFIVQDPYRQCGLAAQDNPTATTYYILSFLGGALLALSSVWIYSKCSPASSERVYDEVQ